MRSVTRSPGFSRLGRVEIAILDALSRTGGLTHRTEVVSAAFPYVDIATSPSGSRQPGDAEQLKVRRARADAAVSRAILTLERKGLVVRDRNPITGRTVLRGAGQPELPVWELLARAEEDLAAHCRRTAAEWVGLANRARQRADGIRRDRSPAATEAARSHDMAVIRDLEERSR